MKNGFTLIELLVVLTIIGILIGVSLIGLSDTRTASRDATRKADLEEIRSGLELYKADCGSYPLSLTYGSALQANCVGSTVTYISQVPRDPNPANSYFYQVTGSGGSYRLCAAVEDSTGAPPCTGGGTCGGTTCNYGVTSP